MIRRFRFLALSAFVSTLAASGLANAQAAPLSTPLIPAPGRAIASNDDASATAQNPANLGFLPSSELRWLYYRPSFEHADLAARGHAFDFGQPLLFGFTFGARYEIDRPPVTAFTPNHQSITAALAWSPGPAFAVGASYTHVDSDSPAVDKISRTALAFSLRPNRYLALAVVGRSGDSNLLQPRVDSTVEGGLALRPTGTRFLELAGDLVYLRQSDTYAPRAVLAIDVPYVGRLRGDVQFPDASRNGKYVATVGLDINAGGAQASGGAIFGNALGQSGAGYYAGLAVRRYSEPGITIDDEIVKLRIESTPGSRKHVKLLRTLWRIAESPETSGVVLQMKAEPADSFAHAEELGDAIRMIKSRGKKVICALEDGGVRSLYVCSQADRIVVNPAGGLHIAGLKMTYVYFASLLEKIGVRAEFVRVAEHKTAPEQLTERGPTLVADADHRHLLEALEAGFLHDVGGGRQISESELRARLARGPFVAREAKEAGLVDGYAYDDDLKSVAQEVTGHHVRVVEPDESIALGPHAPDSFGARPRIALVYIDGDIVDGRSKELPFLDDKLVGSYTIAETLKDAREDLMTRAVVLRIESPGGSSMASDVMWREIALTAREKPVVVSMGGMAASGGYYVAAAGSTIFANRSTITGSIGIFYGKADAEDLLKKIGVSSVTYKTTPRADADSIFRPFTDDERQVLGDKVKQYYDVFVDRVARGRHLTPAQVDAVGRGRVWTGEEAVANGLADHVGGLREAIDEAEHLAELPHGSPIVELPKPALGLLGKVVELSGVNAETPRSEAKSLGETPTSDPPIPIPASVLRLARSLAPLTVYDEGTPLARLDFAILP